MLFRKILLSFVLTQALVGISQADTSLKEQFCAKKDDLAKVRRSLLDKNEITETPFGYTYTSTNIPLEEYRQHLHSFETATPIPDKPYFYVTGSSGPSNRLAFSSYGTIGSVNTGTCWWHSRFQRSAMYLAIFRPLSPGETLMVGQELTSAIKDVFYNRRVVEFRGYSDLYEFSAQNQDLLIKMFGQWALGETFLFGWVKGIIGSPETTPDNLKAKMDQLFEDVEVKNHVAFQVLQVPGIGAHSWLVLKIDRAFDKLGQVIGYDITSIDPGNPKTDDVRHYRFGDTYLKYIEFFNESTKQYEDGCQGKGCWKFVPYTYYDSDYSHFSKAITEYCKVL